MRRIVILGGGFAGLSALRTLQQELRGHRRVEITLVSDRAHFVATSILPKVGSGSATLRKATIPLSRIAGKRATLEVDRIRKIDIERRTLVGRRDYPFDYLIAAPGSVMSPHPQFSNVIPCRSAQDYVDIYEQVKKAIATERRRVDLIVAGGGPCGVVLAASLATSLPRLVSADPSALSKVQVTLIEPSDRLLRNYPEELSAVTFSTLQALGVQTRLGSVISGADKENVTLTDGTSYATPLLFWCGGVEPHPLVAPLEPHLAKGTLESTVGPGMFVAGDIVADRPERKNAYHAVEQGRVAARNVVAQLSGRSTRRFPTDRYWPTILELGDNFVCLTHRNDILVGRPARVYAASQRAKLLGPWMGRMSTLKAMVKVAAARVPEHFDPVLLEEWD